MYLLTPLTHPTTHRDLLARRASAIRHPPESDKTPGRLFDSDSGLMAGP